MNEMDITPLCRGPGVLLRCEVALVTASSTGLVAVRTKLKRAGSGSGLLRVFRTAKLVLIHAASCRFRYSSWTSCGVR
jgi:hypothetical protein